jgi:UDP-glucose 4-epimerase/UDP-arabinose 4-epimerase
MQQPRILVTGGAGYVGAHVCKALAESGLIPVVFDDLSNGLRDHVRWGPRVRADIRDRRALGETMRAFGVSAVVHCAGLIEVGRSISQPGRFWRVNVGGTEALLSAMRHQGVGRLIFSSSAAVYGASDQPLGEDAPKAPASPYGETKLAAEWLIRAQCHAYGFEAVALRYFNAAGADPSGMIGEAHEPETHLIPLAISAATGGEPLKVFGGDFETPDGTCLRDFVHVNDLAAAHVAALALDELPPGGFEAINLGAGRGVSVLEVLEAVALAAGPVPHEIVARRAGDPASLVADTTKARDRLGWTARASLREIVDDAVRWEANVAAGIASLAG